jgi:hypothetical protein
MHRFLGHEPTLRLNWPAGKTLALAAVMLLMLVGVSELAARAVLAWVPATRTMQGYGTNAPDFEIHAALLDREVAEGRPVDCIFLGSSGVKRGLSSSVVEAAYERRTGRKLRCFNLGLAGIERADYVVQMAEFVAARYRPRLLVLGTTPISAEIRGDPRLIAFLDSPWLRYYRGAPSLEGWLVEHLRSYRFTLW